eukprot:Nitzschia sp. Nitz4//scaffold22_size323478//54541//55692//NITZ4_000508-RA/size323478-processed-gene-0.448-mRNA-1//-1//CDS//3329542938//6317//frame0
MKFSVLRIVWALNFLIYFDFDGVSHAFTVTIPAIPRIITRGCPIAGECSRLSATPDVPYQEIPQWSYASDPNVPEETYEAKPLPLSKNAGTRYVAMIWDHEVDTKGRTFQELHGARDLMVRDHVLFCRKRNLYNETFNTDSMVDIMRSSHVLSTDLQRVVGNFMVLESTELKYVQELLASEPHIQDLTGGNSSNIPLYRWTHLRDHTLRQDEGRHGYPCMMIGLDYDKSVVGDLREKVKKDWLEYLISSRKVIAGGPLHVPTAKKDDPAGVAVGDFILFNAMDHDEAIQFAENMPSSKRGLYRDLRVQFFNILDVTGQHVSHATDEDATPVSEMYKELEDLGYPVGEDDGTPWLNY